MCTLYDKIQSLCKQKGVSASRMCLELGLSKSTMSNMKSGRTSSVSTATAQKIASYLGVSVGYLLGEEENEDKKEKPTEYGGLSEKRKALIDFAMSVPEDKAEMILRVMKSILAEQ